MTVPDRSTFENSYAGRPPWDIGRPQEALIDVTDQVAGKLGSAQTEGSKAIPRRSSNIAE